MPTQRAGGRWRVAGGGWRVAGGGLITRTHQRFTPSARAAERPTLGNEVDAENIRVHFHVRRLGLHDDT